MIFRVFHFFQVFGASLLWIMGDLAGGGSVAVAVGLVTGDRWKVKGDR